MSTYAGTVALARLALRRDRVLVPVTAVLLVALAGGSASATVALYPEPAAALAAARAVVASPAVLAMYGPIDATNPDSIAAFKTLTIGAMLVAALAVTLVTRHTRADEEAGRTELLGAGAIGRRAPLTAAVLLATAVVAAVSLAAGLSMASAGLGLRGSLAFSAAWATTGVAFVGVTAVAAQVAGTARGCAGLAYAVLGGAYLVRAVGDTTPLHWLVWVSPVGWAQEVGAFGDDRVGVLLLGVTWSAALVAVAVGLLERRDLGAGLLPTRPGPVVAAASLRTPSPWPGGCSAACCSGGWWRTGCWGWCSGRSPAAPTRSSPTTPSVRCSSSSGAVRRASLTSSSASSCTSSPSVLRPMASPPPCACTPRRSSSTRSS